MLCIFPWVLYILRHSQCRMRKQQPSFILISDPKAFPRGIREMAFIIIIITTDTQIYERVYLPQMCNINTEAMNKRLITNTGTGPTLSPGESSV